MTATPRRLSRLQQALESGHVRIAFLGQATYFDYCALETPANGLRPRFFDYRFGEDVTPTLAELRAFAPHAVVMFRPELLPAGAMHDIDAVTIGFLTEPVPRTAEQAHPDLERRLDDLRMIDPSNWDRVISFDPLVAERVDEIVPVWRSMPLPVTDRWFGAATRRTANHPQILFTGRSTPHRENFLGPAKHIYDVIHVVHGITGDRLLRLMGEVDVGLNLHNEPYPSFENRICVYTAAGLVVISEPLSPTHGLEPGIDYVEVRRPEDLMHTLFEVHRDIAAYDRIRIRGRQKAERFRASRVYGDLVNDVVLDLEAFGTERSLEARPMASPVPSRRA